MANEQNLTAPPIRSGEEAVRKGRAGGIASGKARREKKSLQDWARDILAMDLPVKAPDGSVVPGSNVGTAIVMEQVKRSLKYGDTKAAKFVASLLGEMQTDITFNVTFGDEK